MSLKERFEKYNSEFGRFERIESKRVNRADLHAFLLLYEITPNPQYLGKNIIFGATHDEIWLDVETEDLEECTDETLIELIRCGVRIDSDNGVCMFV